MNIPIFVYKLQGYVLGCIYFILIVDYNQKCLEKTAPSNELSGLWPSSDQEGSWSLTTQLTQAIVTRKGIYQRTLSGSQNL